MTEGSKRPVADTVKGYTIGATKDGQFVVAKFDLGFKMKTLIFPFTTIRWLLVEAPVVSGDHSKFTVPDLTAEDWDGKFTPVVTNVTAHEASDGMALVFDLNTGPTDGLYFTWDCWSFFIKNLWQYQPHLMASNNTRDSD